VLAKMVGRSRDAVQYRIDRLMNNGVLQGHQPIVDIESFGYAAYHIFLRLSQPTKEHEDEVITRLRRYPFSRAVITCRGKYDLELAVIARSLQEFDTILSTVLRDCGRYVQEFDTIIKTRSYVARVLPLSFLPEKEPGAAPAKQVLIDETDIRVLHALAKEPLAPYYRLGERVGVSHDTVQYRIKRMILGGILLKIAPIINYARLGYSTYTVLMRFNGLLKEERFAQALRQDRHVLWAIKCVGRYNALMYVCVQSTEELNETLSHLRRHSAEAVLEYEILIAYEEHKYTYFPVGVTLQG
jgi:DNA-binding Lrp family transcriptional regulator